MPTLSLFSLANHVGRKYTTKITRRNRYWWNSAKTMTDIYNYTVVYVQIINAIVYLSDYDGRRLNRNVNNN